MKRKLIYAILLVAAFLSIAAGISTWTLMEDTLSSSDLIGITDVSDTTQSASGTSKRLTFGSLLTWMQSSLSFQEILSEGAFVDGDKTKLDNQSGTNTGDQDISGISTNAAAIALKEDALSTCTDGQVKKSSSGSWVCGDDNNDGTGTVDTTLQDESTNPVTNNAVYDAIQAAIGQIPVSGTDFYSPTYIDTNFIEFTDTFAVNLQSDNDNLLWTTGTTFLAYLQTLFEGIDTTILKDADIDVEIPAYSHFANQTAFEAEFFTLPSGSGGGLVSVPTYSDSTCTAGTYAIDHDNDLIYYCYATDTWDRVTATFADWSNPTPVYYTLTVTDPGNSNVISSSDSDLSAAIDCGDGATDCTAQVLSGATITGHTGTAASGYEFTAWTGADTSSENPATTGFTMTGDLSLGATFSETACSTPSGYDEMYEGFIGTGYELTWTETVDGTSVVDEDTDISGLTPPTAYTCSDGLTTTHIVGDTTSYTEHDLGAAISASNDIEITWIFYVDGYTLPNSWDRIYILNFDDDQTIANTNVVQIGLERDGSGNFGIRARASANLDPMINLSVDTWYRMVLTLDGTTAADSAIDVDGWTGSTWTDVGAGTFTRAGNDGRYLRIGASADIDTDEGISVITGFVGINTP